MALAAITIWTLISRRYSTPHPILDKVRANFALLNPEYADIPLRSGNSAYTENKSVITLCLVNPETNRYYDMNTIMYVALHELSHCLTHTHGHDDNFRKNFANILRQGAALGIYDPSRSIPTTYCGIESEDEH